jgi:hypothetical protein
VVVAASNGIFSSEVATMRWRTPQFLSDAKGTKNAPTLLHASTHIDNNVAVLDRDRMLSVSVPIANYVV